MPLHGISQIPQHHLCLSPTHCLYVANVSLALCCLHYTNIKFSAALGSVPVQAPLPLPAEPQTAMLPVGSVPVQAQAPLPAVPQTASLPESFLAEIHQCKLHATPPTILNI
mgnify:CR=1 FL=1